MSESLEQKYERILSMCDVGKRSGAYTQIRCPVSENHKHGDKEKSASLGLHSNGISFKCFAGCQTDDFLHELGLTYKDLFPDNESIPTNIYTYHNEDGSYHHDKVKYRNPNTGKKDFRQRTIDESGNIVFKATSGVPYRLPQLIEAIKNGKLILKVEGEKDAETAKILGYESTTMGGASDWKDEYKKYFKDAILILIPDKDDPGLKLTAKEIDSLKTVCKSLKTMILPMGKDLTEWVEAGNYDLRPLIDNAIEHKETNGIPEPVIKEIVGGYELFWIGLGLQVIIDHIEDEDSVEISVFENGKPIYISGYKLLSISHKDSLAKSLKRVKPNMAWDTIINQITVQCLSRIRKGEDVVILDSNSGMKQPDYLIFPLFVKNNANIIYAERSSAKSLFITFIDILLTLQMENNPFGFAIPQQHKLLFLDWENDKDTTGWTKQCLVRGLDMEWCDIAYLHCSRILSKSLHHIESKINEVGADVIIIDSLGVAVGGNLNDSEPALNFFNALRQLPVTPLILAHTSKDITNKRKTVYGNVYYENLSRSIWELSKSQENNSNELALSLFQRKAPPFSGYSTPLGMKFTFLGGRTLVTPCEPMADKRDEA